MQSDTWQVTWEGMDQAEDDAGMDLNKVIGTVRQKGERGKLWGLVCSLTWGRFRQGDDSGLWAAVGDIKGIFPFVFWSENVPPSTSLRG